MTQDERVHEILYSTDSREELAVRIAELEEIAQVSLYCARIDCERCKYCRHGICYVGELEDDLRELGIEVSE